MFRNFLKFLSWFFSKKKHFIAKVDDEIDWINAW